MIRDALDVVMEADQARHPGDTLMIKEASTGRMFTVKDVVRESDDMLRGEGTVWILVEEF